MADAPGAENGSELPRWFLSIVAFIIAFFLFFTTYCRGPYGDFDSLELSAAVASGGLPHPGGYPTYHLLGRFAQALSPYETARTLNLMSAFFGAVTVFVLCLLLGYLLKDWTLALLSSLILATTLDFWRLSVVAEVYTLHTFFIVVSLYLLTQWVASRRSETLFLAAFLFALALGNHATTIFLLPAAFVYLIVSRSFPNAGLIILCGLLVLTITLAAYFLYLPTLATSENAGPFALLLQKADGSRPDTSTLWSYISGKVYREQLWSVEKLSEGATNIVGHALVQFDLAPQLSYCEGSWIEGLVALLHSVLLVCAAIGAFFHLRGERNSFVLLFLFFGMTGFFYAGMGTTVQDMDSMYLPLYLCLTIWMAIFFKGLLIALRDKAMNKSEFGFKFLLALFIVSRVVFGFEHCDFSQYKWMDETLTGALEVIPAEATVIADFQNAMLFRYGQVARNLHQGLEIVPYGLVNTAFQSVYQVKSSLELYANWSSRIDLALRMRPRGVYTTLCNPRYLADYEIERVSSSRTHDIYRLLRPLEPTFVDEPGQGAVAVNKAVGDLYLAAMSHSVKSTKSSGQLELTLYWQKGDKPPRGFLYMALAGPDSTQLRRLSTADRGSWLLWRIGHGKTKDKWPKRYLAEKRTIFLPHQASPLVLSPGEYRLAISPPPHRGETYSPLTILTFEIAAEGR